MPGGNTQFYRRDYRAAHAVAINAICGRGGKCVPLSASAAVTQRRAGETRALTMHPHRIRCTGDLAVRAGLQTPEAVNIHCDILHQSAFSVTGKRGD